MSGSLGSLYTNNHQLNYDEAIRRIQYWVNHPTERSTFAIRMLAAALDRNRNNLYFEPREDANV